MIVFVNGIGTETTAAANDRASLGVLQRYFFALIEYWNDPTGPAPMMIASAQFDPLFMRIPLPFRKFINWVEVYARVASTLLM